MFKVMSEALAEFKMIFDILDWGNTGFLTAQQLSAIMKQYGYNHNEEEVQQMIDVVDCDGTGHMGFSTFCAALCASMTISKSSRSL